MLNIRVSLIQIILFIFLIYPIIHLFYMFIHAFIIMYNFTPFFMISFNFIGLLIYYRSSSNIFSTNIPHFILQIKSLKMRIFRIILKFHVERSIKFPYLYLISYFKNKFCICHLIEKLN